LVADDDRHAIFFFLQDRFGIPEKLFDDYLLLKREGSWWLFRKSPFINSAIGLKVVRAGLRSFSNIGRFIKPTTRFIQIFGQRATRARFEIDEKGFRSALSGEAIPLQMALENGYVILLFQKQPLGLGLLLNGMLHPQIPRKELASRKNSPALFQA